MAKHMPEAYSKNAKTTKPKKLPVTVLTGFLGSGKVAIHDRGVSD